MTLGPRNAHLVVAAGHRLAAAGIFKQIFSTFNGLIYRDSFNNLAIAAAL